MSAVISPCTEYRYLLSRPARVVSQKPAALFCMLNPSRADGTFDDPTIRRCWAYADFWRCEGLVVVNAFGLRSKSPTLLFKHQDPIGPENDYWLRQAAKTHGDVVCAWGNIAPIERVHQVVEIFRQAGARLLCLGTNSTGQPRHPLYVRADQPLIPWEFAA